MKAYVLYIVIAAIVAVLVYLSVRNIMQIGKDVSDDAEDAASDMDIDTGDIPDTDDDDDDDKGGGGGGGGGDDHGHVCMSSEDCGLALGYVSANPKNEYQAVPHKHANTSYVSAMCLKLSQRVAVPTTSFVGKPPIELRLRFPYLLMRLELLYVPFSAYGSTVDHEVRTALIPIVNDTLCDVALLSDALVSWKYEKFYNPSNFAMSDETGRKYGKVTKKQMNELGKMLTRCISKSNNVDKLFDFTENGKRYRLVHHVKGSKYARQKSIDRYGKLRLGPVLDATLFPGVFDASIVTGGDIIMLRENEGKMSNAPRHYLDSFDGIRLCGVGVPCYKGKTDESGDPVSCDTMGGTDSALWSNARGTCSSTISVNPNNICSNAKTYCVGGGGEGTQNCRVSYIANPLKVCVVTKKKEEDSDNEEDSDDDESDEDSSDYPFATP